MRHHQIALPDTVNFEHMLFTACGAGYSKALVVDTVVVLNGKPAARFVVRDQGIEVFRSEDLTRAVEVYNAT